MISKFTTTMPPPALPPPLKGAAPAQVAAAAAPAAAGGTTATAVPCSLCARSFANARDLGKHILHDHAEEDETDKSKEEASHNNNNGGMANWSTASAVATPIPAALRAIQAPATATPTRTPTAEELRQRFLFDRLSDSSVRYTCLLCGKIYTSRYNIRMHLNMHTGRNVHTCEHCGRFFAHKHVFESHVRTHTGERPFACTRCGKAFGDRSNCTAHQKKCIKVEDETDIVKQEVSDHEEDAEDGNRSCFGPQIVSVQSVRDTSIKPEESMDDDDDDTSVVVPTNFSDLDVDDIIDDSLYDEDLEEIQIEPDIIDYNEDEDEEEEKEDEVVRAPSKNPTTVIIAPPPPPSDPNSVPVRCLLPQQPVPVLGHSCSFCGRGFVEQAQLISHLSEHISLPKAAGSATAAGAKSGATSGSAATTPAAARTTSYVCLACGKAFAGRDQMSQHMRVHADERRCRFCAKTFDSLAQLDTHLREHGQESAHRCPHCNASFACDAAVQKHQKSCPMNLENKRQQHQTSPVHRTRSVTKKCKVILNRIEKEDSPEAKKRRLPPELRPLGGGGGRRRGAGYVPDNNSNNVISVDEIDPPPTAEERQTGYCFRQLANCGGGGELHQRRIVCVDCGKHYTTMYNMRQHRNIHTGKNLYACSYCGKTFTHKHVWETHERIHTGERPFKCQHCGKDFADRSNYNSHRKLCESLKRKQQVN